MKKILTYLSFAILITTLIVALILRFKYPHMTDIQFFLKYWYLYILSILGIAIYVFGKGMIDK